MRRRPRRVRPSVYRRQDRREIIHGLALALVLTVVIMAAALLFAHLILTWEHH